MRKPLHLMTQEEKAALAAELKKEADMEGDLPVFIGNPKSLFASYRVVGEKRAARKPAVKPRAPKALNATT